MKRHFALNRIRGTKANLVRCFAYYIQVAEVAKFKFHLFRIFRRRTQSAQSFSVCSGRIFEMSSTFVQQLSYIVPAISITFLLVITSINVYLKIRRNFPATVNCWFCNVNTKVPYVDANSWTCPACEQYNGFTAVRCSATQCGHNQKFYVILNVG